MRRTRLPGKPSKLWLSALIAVTALSLFAFFVSDAQATDDPRVALAQGQLRGFVFNENLTVAEGEVYEDDVTVTAGNVRVEAGGLIEGNLTVWSGDIEIRADGEVEGDVAALSGNVLIAGDIGGDVSALSGNVELRETASVDGDVSVMSGSIQRARGAEVDGNIVQGPELRIPRPFEGWFEGRPVAPDAPEPILQTQSSFWGWLGGLVLRMLLAVIFTVIVVVLTAVLYNARPDLIQPLRTLMLERTAYSFVIGLVVNGVLAALAGGLIATFCLAPIGLFAGLILLALNLVGWTVVSHYVGERVARAIHTPMQPVASVALGALLLTGSIALVWALGGCFRPVAHLAWLLLSSAGVGAFVARLLKLDGRTSVVSTPATEMTTPPPSADVHTETPATATAQAEESSRGAVMVGVATPTEVTAVSLEPEADFTLIRGIGVTFDQRLKAGGVRTFSQLAALTPEQVATILGSTPELVIADDLISQARALAEAMGKQR